MNKNVNKKYSIREECKYGHPIGEGDSCQLGHPKILMMILDCAHQLCFFHTKPSYYVSSVEKQTIEDQLKQTIEDHFISAHGLKHENELESQKEDTEETTGAVTDEIKSADSMTEIKKMASRMCVLATKLVNLRTGVLKVTFVHLPWIVKYPAALTSQNQSIRNSSVNL